MPVHDWTKTDAATFHAFHTAWITHMSEALNKGLLPTGYYALPEQHAGSRIADVLTLHSPEAEVAEGTDNSGGLIVADAPPKTQRKLMASTLRSLQRTLAVRHVSGHQIVAFMEIVSPANKDRRSHVEEFVDKAEAALLQSVHVLVADLLPPGKFDPSGMHGAIWDCFDDEAYVLPSNQPLTLASYTADSQPIAYVEHLAVGDEMIDMPLFLSSNRYINVPMGMTYQAAFQGLPSFVRDRLNPSK